MDLASKGQDSKQRVPQVSGGFFHDFVDFASKDQVQNNKFYRWPMNFSTTYGFFSEKSKYDVD